MCTLSPLFLCAVLLCICAQLQKYVLLSLRLYSTLKLLLSFNNNLNIGSVIVGGLFEDLVDIYIHSWSLTSFHTIRGKT